MLVSMNRMLSSCVIVSADFACFSLSHTTKEEKQNITCSLSPKLQLIQTKAVQIEFGSDPEPLSSVITAQETKLKAILRGVF